jgi:putative ABC transport system permease protein
MSSSSSVLTETVGLHLDSGAIVTAVIGPLAAAVLAAIAVTSKTLKRQAV